MSAVDENEFFGSPRNADAVPDVDEAMMDTGTASDDDDLPFSSASASDGPPVALPDSSAKTATVGALFYLLSQLVVLGFTKSAGPAEEAVDQINLMKLLKLMTSKGHLGAKDADGRKIWNTSAAGLNAAPTAVTIANAFVAHRHLLERDAVLGPFADATVTKSSKWGKTNHWLLVGFKPPPWALGSGQPPALSGGGRSVTTSPSTLLPAGVRGKTLVGLYSPELLREIRNLLHHGETTPLAAVETQGQPGACAHANYASGACAGCGATLQAVMDAAELLNVPCKYYRKQKIGKRKKKPTTAGRGRSPGSASTSAPDLLQVPSSQVPLSPTMRRLKISETLATHPDLISPMLQHLIAAANLRKLPPPAAAPTLYGNVSAGDYKLAQIVTMVPGATNGPQVAQYMTASAEVIATYEMQQRQDTRVRRASDGAADPTPRQRPRHAELRELMSEASVPIGFVDDAVNRLAEASLTDLSTLSAAYTDTSLSGVLVQQTGLPLAVHMALRNHFAAAGEYTEMPAD